MKTVILGIIFLTILLPAIATAISAWVFLYRWIKAIVTGQHFEGPRWSGPFTLKWPD
jgi:hypothetical protein